VGARPLNADLSPDAPPAQVTTTPETPTPDPTQPGSSTLNYLLGDHLGSTSITADSAGPLVDLGKWALQFMGL